MRSSASRAERVAATVMICAGIALFLWINDGWYGAGWGDSGILFNMLAAVLMILDVTIGVVVGRMKERAADNVAGF